MTTSSTNYTGLYSGNVSSVIPNTAYGNANVVALLAAGTDGANTVANVVATSNISGGNLRTAGQISATGNITTANYFIGTFLGNIAGNLTVPGANTQVLYNNSGNAGASAGLTFNSASNALVVTGAVSGATVSATGNVTGNYYIGNGSQLTGIVSSTYGNAQVATFLASFGSNSVSTTGNVTASYFSGNGSQLTGLPANYGNANVASFLSSFGSNSVSTTGNITAGYFSGNGSLLSSISGANVTGTVANATYAVNSNAATYAGTVTTNAQPNITSVGILTSINTSGNISATGNIQGNVFTGNGAGLTNIPGGNIVGGYGNANVVSLLSAFGSNSVSTTGNITASYFTGNGSLLSSISGANVTGTVANATYAVNSNAATYAGTVTTNAQPNITSVGVLTAVSVSGNTTTGNLLTGGIVSATGNITGNYFIGNGSQLTGITAGSITAAGSNTQIQYNNAGPFAGNAAMVFDNTTGNVTLSTLIIGNNTANNANGATKLNTSATFVGQPNSSNVLIPGQILIGNGLFGTYTANTSGIPVGATRGSKVVVWDSVNLASANRYATMVTMAQVVTAANANPNLRGAVSGLQFGGGASANTSATNAAGIIAVNQSLTVGGGTLITAIGNTVATGATAAAASISVSVGSNLRTGVMTAGTFNIDSGAVIGNSVGFLPQFTAVAGATVTACYGYYFPDNTNTWGYAQSNTARAAGSYYSIFNADAVAQNQLGSLRAYHTLQAAGTSTGTWNIDKTNGQIQAISTTGNVTVGSFTNFVTTASNSVSSINQSDTVTLIIEQGATPFTVTMPTGNASIKYAGNLSTVASTANSVTMVAITAYRTSANVTGYLTTISPGFV